MSSQGAANCVDKHQDKLQEKLQDIENIPPPPPPPPNQSGAVRVQEKADSSLKCVLQPRDQNLNDKSEKKLRRSLSLKVLRARRAEAKRKRLEEEEAQRNGQGESLQKKPNTRTGETEEETSARKSVSGSSNPLDDPKDYLVDRCELETAIAVIVQENKRSENHSQNSQISPVKRSVFLVVDTPSQLIEDTPPQLLEKLATPLQEETTTDLVEENFVAEELSDSNTTTDKFSSDLFDCERASTPVTFTAPDFSDSFTFPEHPDHFDQNLNCLLQTDTGLNKLDGVIDQPNPGEVDLFDLSGLSELEFSSGDGQFLEPEDLVYQDLSTPPSLTDENKVNLFSTNLEKLDSLRLSLDNLLSSLDNRVSQVVDSVNTHSENSVELIHALHTFFVLFSGEVGGYITQLKERAVCIGETQNSVFSFLNQLFDVFE